LSSLAAHREKCMKASTLFMETISPPQKAETTPTARVICSKTEALECLEEWRRFQRHPNVDWDFYWHINQVFDQKPCILELRENGAIRSIWAGRLEKGRLPIHLGYLKLGGIRVGQLTIITGGVMGDDSEEACRLLLLRAVQLLSEKRLDMLVLSYLPTGHALFNLARTVPKACARDWGIAPTIHWRMTLPASFEEFLKKRSKKHRYWLNRLPRVLEEAYPGQVRIRLFKDAGDVDTFCEDADTIGKVTYQDQLGDAFRANADYKTRCRLLAERGALRGYILYIGDQPKAYWMATICQNTAYLNLTGYCPEFRKFELGTVLLMKLFEDHCGTKVQKVDFGHGGAMYKERFGDESFQEASVRVYRLNLRGTLANFLTGANARISAGIRTLLSKLGLLQKMKTLWRGRLTG
jgi:hypothetical protein